MKHQSSLNSNCVLDFKQIDFLVEQTELLSQVLNLGVKKVSVLMIQKVI